MSKTYAFVPGYKHDIFVSYAWVDNNPVKGIKIGWVSHLVDTLKNIIAQEIGRPGQIKIWMDIRNDSKARVTPEILERLEGSATLLMIFSPGYFESNWCKRELNVFRKKLKSDSSGSLRQIFLVEKTTRRVKRPKWLEQVISYPLWHKDDSGKIRTLGWPKYKPEQTEYYHRVQDLVEDLVDELIRLKEEAYDESAA